jgi:chromosomal replication initiation ATPase DnaA
VQVETARVLEQFHRQRGPARHAYRQFMKEGLPHGHDDRFYETVDQRFLGDEQFLDKVTQRAASPAGHAPARRIPFGTLLTRVAQVQGMPPRALVAPGRQRAVVPARAMLVYFAREWGQLTTHELGKRLRRDPSMISRLYAAYAAQRDDKTEAQLWQLIAK